jgi:hypothetical protein
MHGIDGVHIPRQSDAASFGRTTRLASAAAGPQAGLEGGSIANRSLRELVFSEAIRLPVRRRRFELKPPTTSPMRVPKNDWLIQYAATSAGVAVAGTIQAMIQKSSTTLTAAPIKADFILNGTTTSVGARLISSRAVPELPVRLHIFPDTLP